MAARRRATSRYDRAHTGQAGERSVRLTSGDPGRGDPAELNPEELVVMRKLCELAHRECYVANSLTSEMAVEPLVERGS